jgi:hypothetical protein
MCTSLKADFLVVLRELETDPYIRIGGIDWRESKAFGELQRRNFPIRILKGREIKDWRVFYYVDDTTRTVLIKEIVQRDEDDITYGKGPHVQRLIDNYNRFRFGERKRI